MNDDPIAVAQSMIADARREFAQTTDVLLGEVRTFADKLTPAIGEIGSQEAYDALRRFFLEKLEGLPR